MIEPSAFETERALLFGLAYRLTGLAGDAEDLVHEVWLRASCDPEPAADARAYLVTMVTRLALERTRAARSLPEQYVGPWLPEPVLTNPGERDDAGLEAETLTLGFLLLLQALSPTERAAVLLRDVLRYEYDDVAFTMGLTPANCRQLVHRARMRVGVRPRLLSRDPERERRLAEQAVLAAAAGEIGALTQLLRGDVTCTIDEGSDASARRPVAGADAVGRFLAGMMRTARALGLTIQAMDVNHETGLLASQGGRIESVWTFSSDGDRITAIRAIRNPAKLRFISRQVAAAS
jgi:RNA polymerase sigma-70 factor, ECF subfamily